MVSIVRFFSCVFGKGHSWTNSKKHRGMMTCQRCHLRRKWN